MKYLTLKEVSKKWGVSQRRVNQLCIENRIKGAYQLGSTWAIPENAEKPADARIKSGKYISFRDKKGKDYE